MRVAMTLHDKLLAEVIGEYRGHIVETGREGDSMLAVFAWAGDAVKAAAHIQRNFRRADWPDGAELKIRIALHTGEAEFRGGHYYGQALYRCARLLAAGSGGQVLLSLSTRQVALDMLPPFITLIDHGEHRLKDLVRPERIYQLADAEAPPDRRPIRSLDRPVTNLPTQLTAMVGREAALEELAGARLTARLLTLTGEGGVGKTRLALELASGALPLEADGVWLVELAPLVDADSVAPAIGRVLGLVEHAGQSFSRSLVEQLCQRQMLLLLDNCEHLIGAVAGVAESLLQGCPGLTIVATSREPLGVPGEVSWRVPPLATEAAVDLFLKRAREHLPDLGIDDTTKLAAAQVCARLDGLPLALELAAAQVDALSVAEIALRLENRFILLSRGARTAPLRQQTLLSTVEWSHNLLDSEERTLLRRLSVFAATFDLAGAEAVAAGGELVTAAVVPCLTRLVRKSLVVATEGRYRLHETVREFARERLADAAESAAVLHRLSVHLLGRLDRRTPGMTAEWLDLVELEQENLKAALAWCCVAEAGLGRQLAHCAYPFWNLRGHVAEGRRALDAALAVEPDESPILVECLIDSGALAYLQDDPAAANRLLQRALEIGEAAANERLIGRALYMSALVEAATGDPVRAEAHLEQALPLWQGLADARMEAEVLHQMGLLAGGRGDSAAAESLFRRSLDLRKMANAGDEAHITLTFLAAVKVTGGDIEGARTAIRESLELGRRLGDRRAAWALNVCSWIAASDSQADRALVIAGAAEGMHSSAGAIPPAIWQALTKSYLELAAAALSAGDAAAAMERGRSLSYREAIEFALTPSGTG